MVLRLGGKLLVSSKWIYKIKHATYVIITKHKSRFVAHGFSHKEEIYYEDTFDHVAIYIWLDI